MSYLIQIKELFMITTEKKFYSIKIKCQKKIFNNIALDLIFGNSLVPNVTKDLMMMKEHSLLFIDKYFKISKPNKLKHTNHDKIYNNK